MTDHEKIEMRRAALFTFSWVFGRVRRTEEVVKLFATARAAEGGRSKIKE